MDKDCNRNATPVPLANPLFVGEEIIGDVGFDGLSTLLLVANGSDNNLLVLLGVVDLACLLIKSDFSRRFLAQCWHDHLPLCIHIVVRICQNLVRVTYPSTLDLFINPLHES